MPKHHSCRVDISGGGDLRLDQYIACELRLFTRSQIRQRILEVEVNGKKCKLSRRVRKGDLLDIYYMPPPSLDVTPEDLPLEVLYEDGHLVVINKKQGMVVHPAQGNYSGTVVNALLYHFRGLKEGFPDSDIRPGIVHRLDKDTSGILIVAKDVESHEFLAREFREKRVKKLYTAVVKGTPPRSEDTVETGIHRDPRNRKRFTWSREGGKRAVTHYRVLNSWENHTLLSLKPYTGRTHQLRVHCRYLRCPIVGDPIYSRKDGLLPEASLMLHASRLAIRLPGSGMRIFKSPLPSRFHRIFRLLDNQSPGAPG